MRTANHKKTMKTINGKEICVYHSTAAGCPILYLNTFGNEGEQVYKNLLVSGNEPFTLVTIENLNWDHDMAPWDIPAISPQNTPCTGGADAYLQLMTDVIVPEVEMELDTVPAWRGLTGYSLAGLFAIYSLYQTDLFQRAASMSGSLWFPGFNEYAVSHEMKANPSHLYFSLGDRECHTRNPYLKTVQENTEQLAAFYKGKNINTVFCQTSGGHFKNTSKRTADGLAWLITVIKFNML